MLEKPKVQVIPNHGTGFSAYMDASEVEAYLKEKEKEIADLREHANDLERFPAQWFEEGRVVVLHSVHEAFRIRMEAKVQDLEAQLQAAKSLKTDVTFMVQMIENLVRQSDCQGECEQDIPVKCEAHRARKWLEEIKSQTK